MSLFVELVNSKNIDDYVDIYINNMNDNIDEAVERVLEIKNHLKGLPNKVKLYRIVVVDGVEEIDLIEPGSHYTLSREQLIGSYNILTGVGMEYYLLTVLADRELIDVDSTIINNILYPNEEEITLKNKGKGSKVVKIERVS